MKTFPFAVALVSLLLAHTSSAIDCVWLPEPVSNDWNTADNWSCGTVPGYEDSVFFAQSSQTQVSVTQSSDAYDLTFQPKASAYEIDVEPSGILYIGAGVDGRVSGIRNGSGLMQNFVARSDSSGHGGLIFLYGNAGVQSTFTTEPAGSAGGYPGNVSLLVDTGQRGATTAGSCLFINQGATIVGADGGLLSFHYGATGDHATIVNQAATVSGGNGGLTQFEENSKLALATITSEGAQVAGAGGGVTELNNVGVASSGATLIADGGSNGGDGGAIQIYENRQSNARFEVFGNGSLEIKLVDVTIGSLEGDGLASLAGHQLRVGTNDLSTTFSGSIQDAGSIVKVGAGTWTLEGVNTYTDGTTITAGTLVANTETGSATGGGPVKVAAGALGGSGRITGPVTVGTGNGTGASLAPAAGTTTPRTLTLESALTFKADGTFDYLLQVRGAKSRSDQVIADGVTIASGAQFNLLGHMRGTPPQGASFTVISNTSSSPISGTFANVSDGATITSGGNNFRASYEGGDGNDLTLTVVP